ncbi:MAG TPA: RNB domain-containing ribonuclease [Candidatus Aphodovivens avicola]|nr:RNB domain-containing ribonuclease [Candidatus Aphodovivens avicola]
MSRTPQKLDLDAADCPESLKTTSYSHVDCPKDGKATCSSQSDGREEGHEAAGRPPSAWESAGRPPYACEAAGRPPSACETAPEAPLPHGAGIPRQAADRLAPLSRIGKLRAEMRRRAGGIDFPSTEAKVRLDADGRPTGVNLRRKTDATSLVEEAMILANEAVAHRLVAADSPALFRVHERPAADGLAGLIPVLEEFDWFARIDKTRFALGDPHAVQAALEASRGRSEGELVGSLLLRAMKRADYRPSCEGHYGLASEAYAHFTSPIRRYPDLVVHHMLKALLFGRSELHDQEASALRWLGRHCSEREREADAAARESQELKLIELMESQVGEAFSGVVSGVAPYGLYVRLDNTAEGLLPVRRLGTEYYSLDAELHRLVGQDSGRTWRLGQRIAVVLTLADARRHVLEFRLAGKTV